ncbi:MAG: sigma-54-dependent Fis family transcriptional regulator [Deltaproteobacteria bacterium]|nr:MAG: sigma-54-dependent Fis family transcriptional regulator [Deltaproteobacteria bacterium]
MNNARALIYVVDDDVSVREGLESLLRSAGFTVQTFSSAQEFLASARADVPSCLVLDVQLPGLSGLDLQQELAKADVQIPIIFLTGHGDIPMSVRAMKAGALEFLTKPVNDEDLLDAIQQATARDHRARQQRRDIPQHNFEEIVGTSAALSAVLKQAEVVAPTESTVLILGETGTGKELIARAIHTISSRSRRAFVKLNGAAIPSGLLESELFGHEKGAFTGAVAQRIGRFELADGGTLFLDEVGDIPVELQPKLLRVLQEHEFERLGSTRTQRVDVRMVAATNRNMEQMVGDKQFREDLYFRLNVFPIRIPPLRERAGDIPLLVRHYVDKYAQRMNKRIETIPEEAMAALCRYSWPGNIRELQNLIERAVILTPGSVLQIQISDLQQSNPILSSMAGTLEDVERQRILEALRETGAVIGGQQGAAARLGLKRTTLLSKMQRLGISRYTKYSSVLLPLLKDVC